VQTRAADPDSVVGCCRAVAAGGELPIQPWDRPLTHERMTGIHAAEESNAHCEPPAFPESITNQAVQNRTGAGFGGHPPMKLSVSSAKSSSMGASCRGRESHMAGIFGGPDGALPSPQFRARGASDHYRRPEGLHETIGHKRADGAASRHRPDRVRLQ
jgi:hypothetical protein